ncbi:MAG: type I DNA topoisomerase [SAR324 cluster bacterium]|nr:type I DNA topoisomerase [SAR324 cluster bacterium]
MPKSLVIVESPTKARTIARFLDDDCIVESSIGHIRDLPDSAKDIPKELKKEPWARLGIRLEDDFKPLYVIPSEKKEQVNKLKKLLKTVDHLYLATDEDREGESISWHLREVLQPTVPTQRLVFHEITKSAIQQALNSPRDIDLRLVNAQETRRVLDRLYGYEISPLLWRKVAPKLSAGRVQSVAVRIIVVRERRRIAFKQALYWDLSGEFEGARGGAFQAELISLDGKRLASGSDFGEETGELKEGKKDTLVLNEQAASALAERLSQESWRVAKSEERPFTTQSPPPFITSTLQQEANRKLGLSSRDTMRLAQSLYEQGHITYMRTDSITLSDQALSAARSQITARYGKEFLHEGPRVFKSQVKNAQEAHEAIRPAGEAFRLPEELKGELNERELRLYDMIWKRTIASQMAPARGKRLVLQVEGGGAIFQATGRHIEFPGYLRAYVEGSDDPESELADQEKLLPDLAQGDAVSGGKFDPREHATLPPARYSEAALIKELEKEGIGRPSTYASIIDTIQRRQYVNKRGSALVPTFTAFAVVQFMEWHFSHLVDLQFTARMEDTLDAISRGEQESLPYLKEFYYGRSDLPGLQAMLQAEIDPRTVCTIPVGKDAQSRPINVRVGKFGPYLERNEERASLPETLAPDELTLERAESLLMQALQNKDNALGTEPESGKSVYLKSGRYGPYLQLGESDDEPKMKPLPPGQAPEEVTLETALLVLALPRSLGTDPEHSEEIFVDLGRYGAYLKRGNDTRSIVDAEKLFAMTLAEAQELFRQEKAGRRFSATALRELGKAEELDATVNLMSGRYGPYVTDGKINASVPRTINPDNLTLADAVELIKKRAAKGPAPKRSRRKAAAPGKGKVRKRAGPKSKASSA